MIVVDTSALVAILMDEPDAAGLEDALVDAAGVLMSAGTLIEIQVVLFRKLAAHLLEPLDAYLDRAGISIVAVSEGQARLSREAFREYGQRSGHPAALNFGDCFPYALAKERGLPLLYKGGDFARTDIIPAV